jgi:hypothetical protein
MDEEDGDDARGQGQGEGEGHICEEVWERTGTAPIIVALLFVPF